jgi:hypothetical protein
MKKFFILSLVLVLLAFSVAPVMAAKPNNGHGNGASSGQNNGVGNGNQSNQQDRDQTREQDRDQTRNNGVGRLNALGLLARNNQTSMRMRTPFYLQGTITSVISDTLTVDVFHGNSRVKEYIGSSEPISITVSTSARIFKITQGDETESTSSSAPSTNSTEEETSANRQAITLADLKEGDIVAIHGNVVGDIFNATLITVYSRTLAGLPEANTP